MSQYISDFIPNRPFGDGTTDLTISSNQTQSQTARSCSGSSGQKNLSISSTGPTNGDLVLIIQMRGTGAGNWEVNRVASGGGTTTLVTQQNLANTYTDSGASQAQVIVIPRYKNVTVNGGVTWTAPTWSGNSGGILVFAARGNVNINGTIQLSERGFVGGAGATPPPNAGETGVQGEGAVGTGSVSTSANGNAGGGGTDTVTGGSHGGAGGGGGGNGGAGATGTQGSYAGTPGSGGATDGGATLADFVLGGGGGGGGGDDGLTGGTGGNGGAGAFIFAKTIDTSSGGIASAGDGGGIGNHQDMGGGGGGSGGSVLIKAQTATLGTTKITALGGTGYNPTLGGGTGGNGGVGRVRCDYGATISGSTNPTLSSAQDGKLIETDPNLLLLL